jgi:hypothetical protein
MPPCTAIGRPLSGKPAKSEGRAAAPTRGSRQMATPSAVGQGLSVRGGGRISLWIATGAEQTNVGAPGSSVRSGKWIRKTVSTASDKVGLEQAARVQDMRARPRSIA